MDPPAWAWMRLAGHCGDEHLSALVGQPPLPWRRVQKQCGHLTLGAERMAEILDPRILVRARVDVLALAFAAASYRTSGICWSLSCVISARQALGDDSRMAQTLS